MAAKAPDTEKISLRMENIWRSAEQRIMEDIVRRIKKTGEITSTADYQINRLIEMGKSREEVEAAIKEALGATWPEMFELYDKAANWQYVRDRDVYDQVNDDFIPPEDNEWLKQVSGAIKKQTQDELQNLAQSYGFSVMLNGRRVFMPFAQYYQKYVDTAIEDVVTGAVDYNTAIRKAVTQMTNSGLRFVDYASGHSSRVDVAVRRSVLTGLNQLTAQVSEQNAVKLGTEYFEVSWHPGARPDHQAWQGKVYSKDQLRSVCGLGSVTGLCGANCRHEYYPFVPGVSERLYTDEWLDEQNRKEAQTKEWQGKQLNLYEQTQQQRKMETAMRAQREKVTLLKEAHADPDDIVLARAKYQAQLDEYGRYCKKMRLPEQRERIYYDMRGRVATNTKKQNARYTKEMMRNADRDSKEFTKIKNIIGDDAGSLALFRQMKYNKPEKYRLLQGYAKAVEKGDIHALTGFKVYEKTAADIDKELVGITTSEGIKVGSYTIHFIDRVIGQTSTSHENMRLGTPIADVKDALISPGKVTEPRTMPDGDVRQRYIGKRASVVISITDKRLIQATPKRER